MENITVNRKVKISTKSELESLSKAELVDRIIQLEAHNIQLKNVLQKSLLGDDSKEDSKTARKFDFNKSRKRHVLLKFLYLGWDYQGYACQEDSVETIEHHLFKALTKTCLIESRETSNYHRCGRTDKGVSAFCQVISIDLRSKLTGGDENDDQNEIRYCDILNGVLPRNIRCIAWMPLKNPLYSARFDCCQRTYRYFFPRGDLNIEAMQSACNFLVGTHDFRNLCKMDVANGVMNFVRTIISADIKQSSFAKDEIAGFGMHFLEITGQGYLWHQIRCIMAVLVLIGQGNEDPDIIKQLLDIETNPCKPQYNLALALPLNLYSCEFRQKSIQKSDDGEMVEPNNDSELSEWIYEKTNLSKLIQQLQGDWSLLNIQSLMMREMISDLQTVYDEKFTPHPFSNQANCLLEGFKLGYKPKSHQKLLSRKRCESLENRLEHYVKKQRLTIENK